MSSFHEKRSEESVEKMREVVENFLPPFANEFFVGIAMRTSALTRLNYARDLKIFFDYLSKNIYKGKVTPQEISIKDIASLEPFAIEQFLSYLDSFILDDKKLKNGENAKQRKLASIRSFFKYFFKKEKLQHDISAKVDFPKMHRKPIVRLEINEVVDLLNKVEDGGIGSGRQQKILDTLRVRDIAILTLLLGTGIRVSECVGLNKNDIDFENSAFTITRKGGDKAILYFGSEVETALKNYFEWLDTQKSEETNFFKNITDPDALFISLKGGRITVRALENLVKKYASVISPLKRITPHKLRATFGTNLYRETGDIYIVADILGHADINTTKKHYADTSEEQRRAGSKAVKLRE